MWGLYIKWPDGKFVLMDRGEEKMIRYIMEYMIENGTDPKEIKIIPL